MQVEIVGVDNIEILIIRIPVQLLSLVIQPIWACLSTVVPVGLFFKYWYSPSNSSNSKSCLFSYRRFYRHLPSPSIVVIATLRSQLSSTKTRPSPKDVIHRSSQVLRKRTACCVDSICSPRNLSLLAVLSLAGIPAIVWQIVGVGPRNVGDHLVLDAERPSRHGSWRILVLNYLVETIIL